MLTCWQSESLQREILDLQSEFEFDRIDYLDTIRKQEQQNKWLQAVVDRMLPVIRRDCNYVNLEKVRALSEWDENNQVWVLPKLTIEKTHLPPAGKTCVFWEHFHFNIWHVGYVVFIVDEIPWFRNAPFSAMTNI